MNRNVVITVLPLAILLGMFWVASRERRDQEDLLTRLPSQGTAPLTAVPLLSPIGLFPAPKVPAKTPRFPGQRVLLTDEETERAQQKFADVRRLDFARQVLLYPEDRLDRRTESNRLSAVVFLLRAISWDKNPRRDYAIALVEEVLTSHNVEHPTDVPLRKSLAGDKVELFNGLLTTDPARAKHLAESVRGTTNGAIVRFAMGWRSFMGGTPLH